MWRGYGCATGRSARCCPCSTGTWREGQGAAADRVACPLAGLRARGCASTILIVLAQPYTCLPMLRRAEKPITIRSDRAAARLALLTRDGRSQARVIEEALDRLPLPPEAIEPTRRRERIEAILGRIGQAPAMAAHDGREYDERGNPR